MRTDDIVVNLICLEFGIVPFCGGSSGHITNSLDSLPPDEKRRSTRKFRKFLKKAIHYASLKDGIPGSSAYNWRKKMYRIATGLEKDGVIIELGFSENKNRITTSQSNIRAKLVRDYLWNLSKKHS